MSPATLTSEETACLGRLCQWVGLDGPHPLPTHLFRAFLLGKLRGHDDGLAAKVAALTDDQLAGLRAEIGGRQAQVQSLVFG